MYEWLEAEINEINSTKFYLLNRKVDTSLNQQAKNGSLLPPSYIKFIHQFGLAKLYKNQTSGFYYVGVIYPPQEIILKNGEKLLQIGHFDDATVYFRYSLLSPNQESPVYEWSEDGIELIAESFEQWLFARSRDARDFYSDEEWQEILNPKPFTSEESDIVKARRQFNWQLMGFDQDGNIMIKVTNNSLLTLPYLSIGLRAKDNKLQGKIWLDVSGVKSGQENIIKHPAYKEFISPDNVELYQLDDPLPEERKQFWEFRV